MYSTKLSTSYCGGLGWTTKQLIHICECSLLPIVPHSQLLITMKKLQISAICSHPSTCCLRLWVFCRDSGENGLGSQHAALHRRVGAFNLRDIHETGAAANQNPSRERQFGDGLGRSIREMMANLFNFSVLYFLKLQTCRRLLLYPTLHTALILK